MGSSRSRFGPGSARRAVVGLGVALTLVLPAIPAPAATPASPGASQPWQAYNFSPAGRTVTPVAVNRTTGTVTGTDTLPHNGSATLTGAGSSATLDFGKEVGGLVSLHFGSADTAGQRLGVAFTESSEFIGTTSDASNGGGGADGALTANVSPNTTWTQPTAQLRGGFRYLTLFAQSAGPISLDHVSLSISFDPAATNLRDYANYFYSSDPTLNRIWYAGAYTVQTNTIAPTQGRVWGPPATGWDNSGTVGAGDSVLVDGAKRDRTVWPGDLGVSVPTEFASLGELTPTRNALTTLYQHQAASGEMPYAGPEVNFYGSDTYHLWSLIGTANYVQYSQDTAWLTGIWAQYRKALQFSLSKVGSDGLMSVTGTADWARGDQGGANIEANALLYKALLTGAQLAQAENDASDATSWTQTAAKLKSAANAQLWDDAAGEYRDNPASNLHPQDGNSLAVWYGLTDSDTKAQRISAALTTDWNAYGATTPENGGQISTFPGSMELQAHLQAGDATRALELMRTEWGYMLNSPLGTGSTFWEGYLANGQLGYGGAYMSNAHGWATGPTSALSFYVLGIRPQSLTGGYLVAPEPGDLSSVQGSLATPKGDIKLSWQHQADQGRFTETLDAPAKAVSEVDVPTFGDRTQVRVNGQLVWDGARGLADGAHLAGSNVVLNGMSGHAVINGQAIGHANGTLSASLTSSITDPVRPNTNVTIPVTVSATGDQPVRGTVSAQLPSGWTGTPASFTLNPQAGNTSTVVQVGAHAPAIVTSGPLTVPLTASAGKLAAHTSAALTVFGDWASGTTAAGSSEAGSNVYQGQVRTYYAGNAIDDNPQTFWNDATPGVFPDTLTVTAPAPVTLHGVGFESVVDGVPTDFTVQTWDGSQWVTSATVTGNSALSRWIPFDAPVTTNQVRVVITASQTQNGNYSRIAELTP
ncbi:MAG TPA: discoidin domain-containing protein [Pseudonocardiaceae bacterium]|nr:discoidin domain-containing protein [Pseudonocardiaceae bacterium]